MEELSAAEARAIALAAQGFTTPRPARVDRRAVRALVERLGVVQIDSVNVLVRSHYLPAFSRLGAYDLAALDVLSHAAPRTLFEYWGHEASLLPVDMHPLFRWRMARAHETAWSHVRRMGKRRSFVEDVLAIVRDKGPIGAGALEVGAKKKKGTWWEWSEGKRAIEWLFWSGQVTSARRKGFERLYDLPERVLPASAIAAATPTEADAQRALIERSARAIGIGTEADLRDYYRLKPRQARPAIAALVEAGVLLPARVDTWKQPAYLHRDAKPGRVDRDRAALLSPFDSLIWARERTDRMFGMKFRLEIYVPQPKRVHGYYVLPLLLGDQLVARVDLKADRAARALRVQAAHAEPSMAKPRVARALAAELARMAGWLGLERVELVPRGDLAHLLSRSLP